MDAVRVYALFFLTIITLATGARITFSSSDAATEILKLLSQPENSTNDYENGHKSSSPGTTTLEHSSTPSIELPKSLPELLKNLPVEGSFADFTVQPRSTVDETVSPPASNEIYHENGEDSMWDEEEYHEPYFGDISDAEESHEGEQQDFEWGKESTHENIDQVEAGLMYLLKTAHRNGFTAKDIINDLQGKYHKAVDENKPDRRSSEDGSVPKEFFMR